MGEMGIFHQLSGVGRTATAASRFPFAVPYSFRAAAATDEQLVYGRFAGLDEYLRLEPFPLFPNPWPTKEMAAWDR